MDSYFVFGLPFLPHPALSKGEGSKKRAKLKSSPCATAKAKAHAVGEDLGEAVLFTSR